MRINSLPFPSIDKYSETFTVDSYNKERIKYHKLFEKAENDHTNSLEFHKKQISLRTNKSRVK